MRHQLDLKFFDMIAREKSIRKAADKLSITSTALNRRILTLEDELGQKLFERSANGVQLNAAGEIFLQYARDQISDLSRIRSRLADLSGMRRGHINVSSCAEMLHFFLPQEIAQYRHEYKHVSFFIAHHDKIHMQKALNSKECDIAMMIDPTTIPEFEILANIKQPIHCVMAKNHPLAQKEQITLSDCLDYPFILPDDTSSVHQLLDTYLRKRYIDKKPDIICNDNNFMHYYLQNEHIIGFQIPIALPCDDNLNILNRPLVESQSLYVMVGIGHLRGRSLSVAAAKFLQQISRSLSEKYSKNT